PFRVAVVAPSADLRAARHRVPRRIRPFYRGRSCHCSPARLAALLLICSLTYRVPPNGVSMEVGARDVRQGRTQDAAERHPRPLRQSNAAPTYNRAPTDTL